MKAISLIDVCLPDYFTGYSKAVVSIPVYQKSFTCSEMADMIESEMDSIFELIEESHSEEEIKIWDNFIVELRNKGDEMYYSDDSFVENEDGEDCAFMYFALVNPVTIHGITFLNQ